MADLTRKDAPSPIQIVGDDEQLCADVRDTGDGVNRVAVDASLSQIPSSKVVHFSRFLLNGASSDMTVNGSVTPVIFEFGPPAGEIWYVFEIGISIEDNGNNTIDSFGAFPGGLTNGLSIDQYINSIAYEFSNIKTNLEMVSTFTDHSFRGQANSFINAVNYFTGKVELRTEVTLVGDNNDKIRAAVRDDLSSMNTLTMTMESYKEI